VNQSADLLLENQQLREENLQQHSQLQQQNIRIQKLEHQLEQLLRSQYGSRSEKYEAPSSQIALSFNLPPLVHAEKKKETITYEREKRSGTSNHKGRLPLPEHLPRVEEIWEPKEDVSGMIKIGEEITERLECEPGKLFVKRIIRPKYAKENNEGVVIADLPSSPIEKGKVGASVLALIIIQKFVDHLPLYRQIEMFKRMGMDIPSSTMSDWVKLAGELITPLYEALVKKILGSDYLQADETRIQVLDRDKKKKTHRGWYWTYRDVQSGSVFFEYHESRGREGPKSRLKNFAGHLQSDGYEVYTYFDKDKITLLHCMAHARRYFEQALDNDVERSEYVLKEIQKLYVVEKHCRENKLTPGERLTLRQEKSLPILTSLHQWLKEAIVQVTPTSAIGKAVAYSLTRWEKLMIYCTNGKLEIDNNLVENTIRPIAIGRKNYLFAGSHEAAQNAAMFYSLLGTCKLKNVEPFQWLKKLFEVLPDHSANKLENLLP
jgi:transposase